MLKIGDEVIVISTGLKGKIMDISVYVNRGPMPITMCTVRIYVTREIVYIPACGLRPFEEYEARKNSLMKGSLQNDNDNSYGD